MNPYEEAIKWIEEEVTKNGVFELHKEMVEVEEYNQPVMDQYGNVSIAPIVHCQRPTANFEGFTCSSQTCHGYNILQVVNAMKREIEMQEKHKRKHDVGEGAGI